jgi:hypothetical protein
MISGFFSDNSSLLILFIILFINVFDGLNPVNPTIAPAVGFNDV